MDFKDQCTREIVRTSTAVVEIRYSLYDAQGNPILIPFFTEVLGLAGIAREQVRAQTQLNDLNDPVLLESQRQV